MSLETLTSLRSKKQELAELAYSAIRNRIVHLELRPGSPVSITQLADELGVSSSPIRDAFQRLSSEGLLVRTRGAYTIRRLLHDEIEYVFEVRALLEQHALRTRFRALQIDDATKLLLEELNAAIGRIDDSSVDSRSEFDVLDDKLHFGLLIEKTGNPFLVGAYKRIAGLLALTKHLNPRITVKYQEEHLRIVSAIIKGDLRAASTALEAHMQTTITDINAALAAERHPELKGALKGR